jgi:hypothetical protein
MECVNLFLFALFIVSCDSGDSQRKGIVGYSRGLNPFSKRADASFLWGSFHPTNENFFCLYKLSIPTIERKDNHHFPIELFASSDPVFPKFLSSEQIESEYRKRR